jgi:hypothetical protein
VRLLIGGCCFLLRCRLSLFQIWCRSPSLFFLENHRGFVVFRGTASEHSHSVRPSHRQRTFLRGGY